MVRVSVALSEAGPAEPKETEVGLGAESASAVATVIVTVALASLLELLQAPSPLMVKVPLDAILKENATALCPWRSVTDATPLPGHPVPA